MTHIPESLGQTKEDLIYPLILSNAIISSKDAELNSGGVLGGIFRIQKSFVPRKSILDLFGQRNKGKN